MIPRLISKQPRLYALVLFSLCLTTAAVSQNVPSNVQGTLTGRVFGISGDGELRPARLARVYAFFFFGGPEDPNRGNPHTPGAAWTTNIDKETVSHTEWLKQLDARLYTPAVDCPRKLLMYLNALSATAEYPLDRTKKWQKSVSHADEYGNFKLTLHPGIYVIVVEGRAGMNDAIWLADWVKVPAGKVTSLKLSSPEQSCISSSEQ